MNYLMCKALQDGQISEQEFIVILDCEILKSYNKMESKILEQRNIKIVIAPKTRGNTQIIDKTEAMSTTLIKK